MTPPITTAERRAAERRADRTADAALLAAAAAGALLALFRLAAVETGPNSSPDSTLAVLLYGAAPVLLALAAYLLTAAAERRTGIRQQRGAMAALTGLAVLSVPLVGFEAAFSPFFGLALIALAVRTRGALAAATGVLALAAALSAGPLTDAQAMAAFALVAVAGGTAAVRSRRQAAYGFDQLAGRPEEAAGR